MKPCDYDEECIYIISNFDGNGTYNQCVGTGCAWQNDRGKMG
ncbi:MAG: hypothetical protein SOW56_01005 [Bacteroidaceae bacterium]|nr:hypothetical protein [Bacteroidaceae bacterium]